MGPDSALYRARTCFSRRLRSSERFGQTRSGPQNLAPLGTSKSRRHRLLRFARPNLARHFRMAPPGGLRAHFPAPLVDAPIQLAPSTHPLQILCSLIATVGPGVESTLWISFFMSSIEALSGSVWVCLGGRGAGRPVPDKPQQRLSTRALVARTSTGRPFAKSGKATDFRGPGVQGSRVGLVVCQYLGGPARNCQCVIPGLQPDMPSLLRVQAPGG